MKSSFRTSVYRCKPITQKTNMKSWFWNWARRDVWWLPPRSFEPSQDELQLPEVWNNLFWILKDTWAPYQLSVSSLPEQIKSLPWTICVRFHQQREGVRYTACPQGKNHLSPAICEHYWKMFFCDRIINACTSNKNVLSKPWVNIRCHFFLCSAFGCNNALMSKIIPCLRMPGDKLRMWNYGI